MYTVHDDNGKAVKKLGTMPIEQTLEVDQLLEVIQEIETNTSPEQWKAKMLASTGSTGAGP